MWYINIVDWDPIFRYISYSIISYSTNFRCWIMKGCDTTIMYVIQQHNRIVISTLNMSSEIQRFKHVICRQTLLCRKFSMNASCYEIVFTNIKKRCSIDVKLECQWFTATSSLKSNKKDYINTLLFISNPIAQNLSFWYINSAWIKLLAAYWSCNDWNRSVLLYWIYSVTMERWLIINHWYTLMLHVFIVVQVSK